MFGFSAIFVNLYVITYRMGWVTSKIFLNFLKN